MNDDFKKMEQLANKNTIVDRKKTNTNPDKLKELEGLLGKRIIPGKSEVHTFKQIIPTVGKLKGPMKLYGEEIDNLTIHEGDELILKVVNGVIEVTPVKNGLEALES